MEIAAIIFVLVTLGTAYVVFRVLKKIFKLLVRAILALIIIAVAIVGGLVLWSAEPDQANSRITSSTR